MTGSELTVGELLAEVRQIELLSRGLVTEGLAGGYSSVFRGQGIEFETVREYVPGDEPRSIDWNVTARVGRPFIKKFVDERELCSFFVFDLSPSMDCGLGTWSSRDMATRLCACLAVAAARSQDRVGWIGVSDHVERYVAPGRGLQHAMRIVRECLDARSTSRRIDLRAGVEFAARALRRRSVVFLVSDFLPDADTRPDDRFDEVLTACARRHDVIAIRIEPAELESAALRRLDLARAACTRTGQRRWLDSESEPWRSSYRSAVDEWRRALDQRFADADVDYLRVPIPTDPTPESVAQPLVEFFARRARRRGRT